jgi:inner membrane protein
MLTSPPSDSYPSGPSEGAESPGGQPFAALRRLRDSALFRFGVSGLLVMVLQIPIGLISQTISERRERRDEAIAEVTRTWGGPQELVGPVVTIPFTKRWVDEQKVTHEVVTQRRVLPRDLRVTGRARIEMRRRGIFDVPLYVSDLHVEGTFVLPSEAAGASGAAGDGLAGWERTQIAFGLSDVGAIRAASPLRLAGVDQALEPGPGAAGFLETGLHAAVPRARAGATLPFSLDVTIGGHGRLSFVPAGDETSVELASTWPHPSFDGAALPNERRVDRTGFEARWRRLHLGRNFPSTWNDDEVGHARLSAASFGVTLLAPVDTYRSNDRAVKYQLLFIGLTFLAFTLLELLSSLRVHAIQYLLVGFALCLFFLLLLSLSEHVGFARAYLTAAVATVALIGGYVRVVLGDWRRGLGVSALLSALYGFLFVLLQLEEYALLFGSIGLFFVLALVMGLTRRVNWYEPIVKRG